MSILFIQYNNSSETCARTVMMWSLCAKDRNRRYNNTSRVCVYRYRYDLSIQLAMRCHIVTFLLSSHGSPSRSWRRRSVAVWILTSIDLYIIIICSSHWVPILYKIILLCECLHHNNNIISLSSLISDLFRRLSEHKNNNNI